MRKTTQPQGAQPDHLYRLDYQDTTNVDDKGIALTIRSVFIIDPKKTIRLILAYPASTGRNTAEEHTGIKCCSQTSQPDGAGGVSRRRDTIFPRSTSVAE
jgi:alkyl hydroperoxide reductase subunit AhpC